MWMRCNRGSVRTRQHYVRNVLSLFTHVVQMQAVEQTVHLAWSLVIDTVDVILVRELSNGKVDRILLRFDHMTRRDLLVEMVKKSICAFRNNVNKHSATKEM